MKITFIGAGSVVFAKNIIADCMLCDSLKGFDLSLFDIDSVRLEESRKMMEALSRNLSASVRVVATTDRLKALDGATFIINAIQVGGYKPCTMTDFEVPKKYGLRQTIADTLGIGGIFRALRTIPVLEGIASDIEKVCPNAILLNYTNPMGILTGYMQTYSNVNMTGLCHSVQNCADQILSSVEMDEYKKTCHYKIAGINHQSWLTEIRDSNDVDLYPEIKRRSLSGDYKDKIGKDMVRHDIMNRFGCFVTESSEHSSEYFPYYIKAKYPELIDAFQIPLDEYPRRCEELLGIWDTYKTQFIADPNLTHTRTCEYGSYIIEAYATNKPYIATTNMLNKGCITNLPSDACVELPVVFDRNGMTKTMFGALPENCAALNRTNINVQLATIKAAHTRKKEDIYVAAYLDPHTSSELSMDDIKNMCDDLIVAHGDWLPKFN